MDLSYAYANARIKAMKSKLFDADRMRELMDVQSLDGFVELLEESHYKEAFVSESTRYRGFELVRRALDKDLVAQLAKVEKMVPQKDKAFFQLVIKQWEINNLKKAIALRAVGQAAKEGDFVNLGDLALVGKINSAKTMAEVAAVVEHSDYGPGFSRAAFDRTGDFRLLLSALDKQYLTSLGKAADSCRDAFTARFLRKRVLAANAIAALRLKNSGVDGKKAKEATISYGREMVDAVLNARTGEEALKIVSSKVRVKFSDAALSSPAVAEMELDAAVAAEARRTLSLSVLSLGVAVAFAHLKQEEVHSLRKIAYATLFDVKDELRDAVLMAA